MASPRPSSPCDPSPGTVVEIQRDPDVLRFTLDNPGHENAVTGAMFDAMLAELRSEAVRPLARVLRLMGCFPCKLSLWRCLA